MKPANHRNLNAALFAMLCIIAYALTADSVFPRGDDLAHLTMDRAVPLPKSGLWVSNRVIDGFFTAFTFQSFELLYSALSGFGNGRDFVDLYRAFNALIYSIALGCAALLLHRTACKWIGEDRPQLLFAWLVAFWALFQWMPPNAGMTDLFAYQITAVITLGFLSMTYPLGDLGGIANSRPEPPFSRSKYLFLSLLAYLTAVGLEAFVAFAWLWIIAHYLTSSRAIVCRFRTWSERHPMFPATLRGSLDRHTIALQFLLYSAWSMHAMTTSGRTRIGLAAGPEIVSWFRVPDLALTAIRSTGGQLLAMTLASSLGYCVLHRVNVPGVRRSKLMDRDTVVVLSTFSFIVGAGYLVGLMALDVYTRSGYVNDARLVLPLKFVLLAQLLMLSLSLLDSLTSQALRGAVVVVSFAFSAAVLADQMSLVAKQREPAQLIRDAFRRAALAPGELVIVPFPLPNSISGNEGYPLLPAAKAADWYRRSYRLMLNKYYGTHFDQSGPVFRANDDTPTPTR